MIITIIGGSGSGKSEYAEAQAMELQEEKKIYIATMEPMDMESKERIKRHQQMRQEKKFCTLERYRDLAEVEVAADATVLLECMSNLVANEMFAPTGGEKDIFEVVKNGLEHLISQSRHVLIVTNNIFEEGLPIETSSRDYARVLGTLNQWLCRKSDRVIEVIHSIPLVLKEERGIEHENYCE